MGHSEKTSLEKEANKIYILLVLIAFVLTAMAMVGFYSDQPMNIYVVSSALETESRGETAASSAVEAASASEPEELLESEAGGIQEILVEKSIDLNHAGKEELEKLPGIGPVLAERILEYRGEYGDFQEIEEVMEVSGIGEKIFGKIQDFIFVE